MAFRIRGARRRTALGRRHAARQRRPHAEFCGRTQVEFRCRPAVDVAANRERPIRSSGRSALGTGSWIFHPCSTIRKTTRRLSTGAIYWEGAVRAAEQRRPVGRGYLEMTGYGARLRLR